MLETSARLLRLLSLLQAHREWSGADLAERLGVSMRTVRRDVERLRELGYPVHAVQGTAGYRLGAGAALPPLLLDDDEAVAVVLALRTATASSVVGVEETAVRALQKLEQVLPARLRHQARSLQEATVRAGVAPGPQVPAETLVAIADACRRREQLRFHYSSPRSGQTVRTVEPHRLVSFGRNWYLVAWDPDRHDWRSFRADRITPRPPNGPRFAPREPPGGDVVAWLSCQLSARTWPYRATVRLHEAAEAVSDRVWPGMGVVEAVDAGSCLFTVGADDPAALVWMLTSVDTDFTVLEGPPELTAALHRQSQRCADAIAPPVDADPGVRERRTRGRRTA
ncbi:transcriptional regulator [Blastococcus montanus]|uniref:helix-turn-helix transcriptional regulator n=1 Tax=Blastococcus montanus TaxID=3144973 RepID=UPI003208F575